jgi:hypothetical protein
MLAVASNGLALKHAAPQLQSDREIVMSAVTSNGLALKHAAPQLREDRAIVMSAVTSNGLALEHAAPQLQSDREIVLSAMKLRGDLRAHHDRVATSSEALRILEFADSALLNDDEFVNRVVRAYASHEIRKHAPENFRSALLGVASLYANSIHSAGLYRRSIDVAELADSSNGDGKDNVCAICQEPVVNLKAGDCYVRCVNSHLFHSMCFFLYISSKKTRTASLGGIRSAATRACVECPVCRCMKPQTLMELAGSDAPSSQSTSQPTPSAKRLRGSVSP